MKKIILTILLIFGFFIFPKPTYAAYPIGWIEASSGCSQINGWVGDPDNPNLPIQIDFWDNLAGNIGFTSANSPRESAVCEALGGQNCSTCPSDQPQCKHAFFFSVPGSVKDGRPHQIMAYGINIDASGNWTGDNKPINNGVPVSLTCTQGDGTISGDVFGSPLTIKTTSRLAGAIDSLTWKGKEFVDSYDHGRQIQTAWSVNGLGQCYNPTEAGSAADNTGPTSSSVLLDFQTTGTNSYYTKSRPAFWDAPGQSDPDGGCNFSLNGTHGPWLGGTAVNKTIVSDWLLEKWVTIGYAGIPNVIKYVSKITVPANPDIAIDYIILDQPSVHLPVGFSVWKQYDPASKSLVPQSTYYGYSNHPHVLMTSDGNFALSVYSPEIPENGLSGLPQYPYLGYMVSFFLISVNGERLAKTEPFPPGSVHTYVSYIVVGTPEQVRQSLQSLYALNTLNPQVNISDLRSLLQNFTNIFDYNLVVGNFGR